MAVKEGLLALLRERPRYGYELKTEFEAAIGSAWSLNVGQVYSTLDRFARDGLVAVAELDESESGRPQKTYELTELGRDEIAAWWDTVPGAEPPPRDELMLKVLMAVQHGREHALEVITRQRTALFSMLQVRRREMRRAASDSSPSAVAQLASELISDALVVRAEADLRWLDQCEQRVLHDANLHSDATSTNHR